MVVSDHRVAAQYIQDKLISDVEVTLAKDIAEASNKADKNDFDVIITNLIVPDNSGKMNVQELIEAGNDYKSLKNSLKLRIQNKIDELKLSLKEKKPDIQSLINRSDDNQAKIIQLVTDKIQSLEKNNVSFEITKKQLENDIIELKKQIEQAEDQKKKSMDQINAIHKQVDDLQKEKSGLEEKIKAIESERDSLIQVKKDFETVQTQLNQLQIKFDQETASLNQTIQNLTHEKESALNQNNELKNKVSSLSEEMEQNAKNAETMINNLKKENSLLKTNFENANNLTKVAQAEKIALEKKVEEFQEYWSQYVGQ